MYRGVDMANFYEIKDLICRILTGRNMEENDDDIFVDVSNSRNSLRGSKDLKNFTISNNELRELYDKVVKKYSSGLQFYDSNYFEIAIDIDDSSKRYIDFPLGSKDTGNGIEYELDQPSLEYSLYLLMLVKDNMNKQEGRLNRVPPIRLRRPLDRLFFGETEPSLATILPKMIGEKSLKIKNIGGAPNFIINYPTYKTSFMFDFMYKTGVSLVEFSDITEIFPDDTLMRRRYSVTPIDTPPLRKYTDDVVDYYKLALSSNDPYIKYISFYHVIEYFFDEVFKRKIVVDLTNKITHPDFSYKDPNKVYDMAIFVKNRFSMKENGQGDEKEALKYVLNEYVSIEDLKDQITAIDANAIEYYQHNKVSFCNAPTISWSDSQGVYAKIRDRIYFTRNSLVHSKSGKNKERYRPYKDEKQLQLEIPLVKAVAELIIINSSEII